MRFDAFLKRLRALISFRPKGGMIQECPPELYACEVCGKLECRSEQWLKCPQRLATAEYVKLGDQQALADLKQLQAGRDAALCHERSTCSGQDNS